MRKNKFGIKECKNLEDISMMLKMFKGQKLIGSNFDKNYTTLYLRFQEFVLCIDLMGAKWGKISDLRIFPSPIIGRIPWELEEDFNTTFKKYKKGKES